MKTRQPDARRRAVGRLAAGLCVAGAALAASPVAIAQSAWPTKPVRFVVPFPPGGATDAAARAVAEQVAATLGQSVLIENRGGASGTIGAEMVARAAPDGYTFLVTADALATAPLLGLKLSFDAFKDFLPVAQLSTQPIVIAVHPSVGAKTLAELVAVAKSKPGMGFATSGAGSQQHVVGEWFSQDSGSKLVHVPYKGGGQAIADLVGGQVPIGSLGSTPVVPHHRAGKLRILAQSTPARSSAIPDVPTFVEAGFKDLVVVQWLGMFAPAGTPAPVVERMNAAVRKALGTQAVRERFAKASLDPAPGTPGDLGRTMRQTHDGNASLFKRLGISVK